MPRKVQPIEGTMPYFLKTLRPGERYSAEQEITAYKRIREAAIDPEVRVPRLHGLVRDDRGIVFGLLLTYIDCRATTLTLAIRSEVPAVVRCKWKDQISLAIDVLHEAGVVWGDVKAENVLVDVQNDAWVVDFGGGYPERWVENDSAGTLAGDVEGMANIVKYLGV